MLKAYVKHLRKYKFTYYFEGQCSEAAPIRNTKISGWKQLFPTKRRKGRGRKKICDYVICTEMYATLHPFCELRVSQLNFPHLLIFLITVSQLWMNTKYMRNMFFRKIKPNKKYLLWFRYNLVLFSSIFISKYWILEIFWLPVSEQFKGFKMF